MRTFKMYFLSNFQIYNASLFFFVMKIALSIVVLTHPGLKLLLVDDRVKLSWVCGGLGSSEDLGSQDLLMIRCPFCFMWALLSPPREGCIWELF